MTEKLPVTAPAVTVFIGDVQHDIAPAKFGQLLKVLALIEGSTIVRDINGLLEEAGGEQGLAPDRLLSLIARHGAKLTHAFGVLLKLAPDQIEAMDIDDVLLLASAAIKVNADFFSQRLMPKLASLMTTGSTMPSGVSGGGADQAGVPLSAATG